METPNDHSNFEERMDMFEECLRLQQAIIDNLTASLRAHQQIFGTLTITQGSTTRHDGARTH